MDEKTREKVTHRIADELIAVHEADRRACWHREDPEGGARDWDDASWARLREARTNIMAAIDEATAVTWTPAVPETMPPEYAPLFISLLNDGGRRVESRGYFGHEAYMNRPEHEVWYDSDAGRNVTNVTHWMLDTLPAPPKDA